MIETTLTHVNFNGECEMRGIQCMAGNEGEMTAVFNRDNGSQINEWIPAFAGMTETKSQITDNWVKHMNIRLCNDSDHGAWDEYVRNHPTGTFFHLSDWKKVVEESFGHQSHYLVAEGDPGKIAGVFPLFSIKSILFGKSMVSVPFGTYGGILADDEEIETNLYQKAVDLTKGKGLDYLEIRNETKPLPDLPGKDLYYVFKKEISGDDEENMKAIPRKARRMVRQGIKHGLQGDFGKELLDPFYDLFAFNYHRLGTPVFSKSYLKNLLETFGDQSSLLLITKGGKPLSGVLSFYYKDQVIPYYSGAYPDSQRHAANDYLYWALMSDAAAKGYRVFDYGRSKKDTGPFHFKRHWGFEPKLLHYQYYLNMLDSVPDISPANPKYQRRIEWWRKLPLWATKLLGPPIVKYIP